MIYFNTRFCSLQIPRTVINILTTLHWRTKIIFKEIEYIRHNEARLLETVAKICNYLLFISLSLVVLYYRLLFSLFCFHPSLESSIFPNPYFLLFLYVDQKETNILFQSKITPNAIIQAT